MVNTFTTGYQRDSAIAVGTDGRFVVVWGSSGSAGADTSEGSIQGRRLETTLFADGFESGDIGAW